MIRQDSIKRVAAKAYLRNLLLHNYYVNNQKTASIKQSGSGKAIRNGMLTGAAIGSGDGLVSCLMYYDPRRLSFRDYTPSYITTSGLVGGGSGSVIGGTSYASNELSNLKNDIYVRRAKKEDVEAVMKMFNSISSEDQKFLAYGNKASLIRQIVRSGRHCYVAMDGNKVVGFLRESGRPDNYSLLEEILVLPECRGKGVATKLMSHYHRDFHKNMAKTNASNHKMICMLSKNGYVAENPDAPRIINWVRNRE